MLVGLSVRLVRWGMSLRLRWHKSCVGKIFEWGQKLETRNVEGHDGAKAGVGKGCAGVGRNGAMGRTVRNLLAETNSFILPLCRTRYGHMSIELTAPQI